MPANPENAPVQSTETSLRIIEILRRQDEVRINDLAEELDIAISTTHRHLQTLRKHGYVVKQGNHYALGLQFLTIGGELQEDFPASQLIVASVEKLANETEERVQFVTEERGKRVFLYTESGDKAVQAEGVIGKRGPLHCSGAGKAILSQLPEERVREIIDQHGLPAVTEKTITDPEALFEELETIRERGIAFNKEESTTGLNAASCPVTTNQGDVLGALSVAGPSSRLNSDRLRSEIAEVTKSVTQELEIKMRYP